MNKPVIANRASRTTHDEDTEIRIRGIAALRAVVARLRAELIDAEVDEDQALPKSAHVVKAR